MISAQKQKESKKSECTKVQKSTVASSGSKGVQLSSSVLLLLPSKQPRSDQKCNFFGLWSLHRLLRLALGSSTFVFLVFSSSSASASFQPDQHIKPAGLAARRQSERDTKRPPDVVLVGTLHRSLSVAEGNMRNAVTTSSTRLAALPTTASLTTVATTTPITT